MARRDVLKLRFSYFSALAAAATPDQKRYQRSELQYIGTVDVSVMQKTANEYARDLRELDTKIQEANWSNDLNE